MAEPASTEKGRCPWTGNAEGRKLPGHQRKISASEDARKESTQHTRPRGATSVVTDGGPRLLSMRKTQAPRGGGDGGPTRRAGASALRCSVDFILRDAGVPETVR